MPRNLQVGRWAGGEVHIYLTLKQMRVLSVTYISQQTLKDSYNSHKKQSVLLFGSVGDSTGHWSKNF